ncbi:phage head-tail connector protein [Thomasclavelia ramosa]|uniref:phage head-tail connector protein n=1 Tax=Thomasclavelia ramosa TaxID=1547 RepID=UPI0020B8E321|nr:phage head-tail connector protein [Thomasclavelia ramosa]
MTILENVKELLGNPKNIDDKLNVIIELTQKRLGNLLSVKEVPEELEYIVIEVSVIRFNRIGSEGVSSHSVEGESMSFNDDDFDSYDKDIRSWLNNQSDLKKGSVRFL